MSEVLVAQGHKCAIVNAVVNSISTRRKIFNIFTSFDIEALPCIVRTMARNLEKLLCGTCEII